MLLNFCITVITLLLLKCPYWISIMVHFIVTKLWEICFHCSVTKIIIMDLYAQKCVNRACSGVVMCHFDMKGCIILGPPKLRDHV